MDVSHFSFTREYGSPLPNSVATPEYMVGLVQYVLSAAPSGIPASISFSGVNLTSITVEWTELPCSERNGEITGYTVEYGSMMATVSDPSNRRLVVGGLLPRTRYTFSVRAQGAAMARSRTVFTATPTS